MTGAFAFVLPLGAGRSGSVASVTLSGPDGTVTLDEDTDMPMAILRDLRTGQVRAFRRGLRAPPRAGSGLELLWSRGIP